MPLPTIVKRFAERIAENGPESYGLEKLSDLREQALLHVNRYKEHKKLLAKDEKIRQQVSEWLKEIDESKTEAI